MKRLIFTMLLGLVASSVLAQEVEGRLPRGWQPQQEYPMAWSGEGDFDAWRTECRGKIFDLMGLPPKAPT